MIRRLGAASLFLLSSALYAQAPAISSVTNESGSKNLCPGGVGFINGTNLGGGAFAVTVAGKQAFVLNAGPTFLQFQVPVDAPLGPTTLTVGTSPAFNVTIVQFAPGLATDGQPDALSNAFHLPSQLPITAAFPAAPGEQIAVTATGLGPTTPVIGTGQSPSDNSAVVNTLPTVTLGGKAVTGVSAFLQPGNPGFYAIVFTVPAGVTAGTQGIVVTVGGVTSNTANIPVATGPIVGSVTNAASYNDPALPNGGIAQGAIFVIKGINLGPATLAIAPAAFQTTTLSGTSVSITVGGVTVAAPLYYTSSTQVAALLPSNVPVGSGTITVTYNSQQGPAAVIRVVANNLGIFTITSDGLGAGIVTYPDYSLVSATKAPNCGGPNTTCGAANPGDVLIIWATGLGAISGGTDASGAGLGVNMSSLPLTVWLGGVPIQAVYQGRSGCCVGEDQIVITVPANVPTGCAVPLVVQINNFVSNGVVIPVAAAGSRTCTLSNTAFATANAVKTSSSGTQFTYGGISLIRSDNYPGFQDKIKAQFARIVPTPSAQPFLLSYVDDPALGTCTVFNNLNGPNTPIDSQTGLNIGSQLTIQGPNGSKNVAGTAGNFQGVISANGNYLSAGSYTVSSGGGTDLTQFSTQFTIPTMPTLTSPAPDSVNPFTVTRANGLTVTWTGGSAGYIEIDGFNTTVANGNTGATFSCKAPAAAGSFTIPPSVWLALPAGSFGGLDFHPSINQINLTGTGLDVTQLTVQYDYFVPLTLK